MILKFLVCSYLVQVRSSQSEFHSEPNQRRISNQPNKTKLLLNQTPQARPEAHEGELSVEKARLVRNWELARK